MKKFTHACSRKLDINYKVEIEAYLIFLSIYISLSLFHCLKATEGDSFMVLLGTVRWSLVVLKGGDIHFVEYSSPPRSPLKPFNLNLFSAPHWLWVWKEHKFTNKGGHYSSSCSEILSTHIKHPFCSWLQLRCSFYHYQRFVQSGWCSGIRKFKKRATNSQEHDLVPWFLWNPICSQ